MRQTLSITVASIASVATCLSVKQTPGFGEALKKIHVTLDDQPLDLYLAGTSWSELGNSSSPATPGDFTFGGECSTQWDDDCNGCDCHWSWQRTGRWDDWSARCRCAPERATYVPNSDYELGFNARVYLSETEQWNYNSYFKPNLLGGSMEYDVDLSEVECGCNAALYTILMPGVGTNGSPFPSEDGMHYCDANQIGGNFCPEFDIMEANVHGYRAVEHTCDAPSNGHFYNCDRHGQCHVDVITDKPDSAYGEGPEHEINTQNPFHIKVDFDEDSAGQFYQYKITLTQDGRQVQMIQNCPEHLNQMTQNIIDGMVFAMSIWKSDDLEWLQHGTCSYTCENPDLRFDNLVFTTKNGGSNDGGSNDGGSNDGGSNDGGSNDGGSNDGGSNDDGNTVDLTAIAAGFEAIRNNPHYGDKMSRTLYQVDQSFDFIQDKLIEMAARLDVLQN